MTTIDRNAIAAAIFDPGTTEGMKGDRTLTEWQTDAVMRVLSTAPGQAPLEGVAAIYIASKTKHADRWRKIASVHPVSSTWIYEAGEGQSADLNDLWRRCLLEAATSKALVAYREEGEVFKGGWVEIGAALSHGVPVHAVGLEEFTIAKFKGITHHRTMKEAVAAALKEPPRSALLPASAEPVDEKAIAETLAPYFEEGWTAWDGARAVMLLLNRSLRPSSSTEWRNEVRADGGCGYCDADQGEVHRPNCQRPASPPASGAVEAGWQIVPKEPTEAMWQAGREADEHPGDSYSAVYRAMLSAAPTEGR